ncbi:FAS1-like dehydratase domain-containing protein [Aquipuribacter hungaricus]|uniref:MaoC family dehydratase N-terminal domain-containing protein n=1 Tax=Aquipuribacter hungaricus TaxID=545624 RepID=A0ABV7WF90_9MICO
MTVDPTLAGRTYSAAGSYVVGRETVRQFADAVGAAHPFHHDVVVAREAGYGDVVAPPTFAVVVAQPATDAMMADPEVGLEYSRIVHGEQTFVHHAPIVAGDELDADMTVASVRAAGGAAMLTLVTQVTTTAGEPRSTVTALLVHR